MTKIVFFSSSHRALPALELLHKNLEVVGVVSQPDKPTGRKQELSPTAISLYAKSQNIPLLKPEKLDKTATAWIADKKPDVIILSYYGLWIPPELFNLTPAGILVTHPSLLPLWRWGSPVQATIISGKETGVSIMKMDEKFDHGPILAAEKDEVKEDDDQETLYTRLFTKGAELTVKILPDYLAGKIIPQDQDHKKATFARHITKEDGFIPPDYLGKMLKGEKLNEKLEVRWMLNSSKEPLTFDVSPFIVERFIRAMFPWPNAWTEVQLGNRQQTIGNRRLKILKAHVEERVPNAQCLVPNLVQLQGKNPVSWKQFKEAYPETTF